MSAIDQYAYTCLGVIECPTPYRFFAGQADIQPVHVAIYRLHEDIPDDETDFQGKKGDILVGGGGGESPAMRIRIPEAIVFYTDFDRFETAYPELGSGDLSRAYWSPTETFKLCSGYVALGWNPDSLPIEQWLTQHILSFLLTTFSTDYAQFTGAETLDYDGSICCKLTDEEDKICNWKTYRNGN